MNWRSKAHEFVIRIAPVELCSNPNAALADLFDPGEDAPSVWVETTPDRQELDPEPTQMHMHIDHDGILAKT